MIYLVQLTESNFSTEKSDINYIKILFNISPFRLLTFCSTWAKGEFLEPSLQELQCFLMKEKVNVF